MPVFIIYLIKANIALTLFYLAYRFGLRRLTFYTLNRFFLLFGITFSAAFPLANLSTFFQQHQQFAGGVAYYAPDWNTLQQYAHQQNPFTVWTLIAYVFWAGVIVMSIRFCMQMLSLFRIHLRTKAGFLREERIRFMHERINPFSFFNNIYINPELHAENELEKILAHEKVHVQGWHSADVLAGEINNIFYWFNPGAWLMKIAIQENLEFITDRTILSSGMDVKSYQYSLIKVSSIPFANPLANNFNFSHLKKRIKMMNKKKSSGFHLLRYLLLLPVIAIAAFIINSSRAQSLQSNKDKVTNSAQNFTLESLNNPFRSQHFNAKGYAVSLNTNSGISTIRSSNGVLLGYFNLYSFTPKQIDNFNKRYGTALTYEDVQAFKNYAQVLKNHPTISNYYYESPDSLYIWTKGYPMPTAYNLNNTNDRNLLLKKYDIIPPDYIAVVKHDDAVSSHLSKDYQAFLKRNPSVENLAWGGRPVSNSPTFVIVHLKNGETERYHLDNKKEMKKGEAKYGKFPAPPPPPPPAPARVKSTSYNNLSDTTGRYYAQLSYQKAREKDYVEAESYANKALKLNSDNAKATSILRYVHQMKEYNEKMEAYKKERENKPMPIVKVQFTPPKIIITDSSEYFASASEWEARKKNYEAATSYAHKSLQLNPDNAKAKQVLRYVNQMKEFQEKMEEYEKAHKDLDSAPTHAVNFNDPVNDHGPLSETSSGKVTLFPAPPVDQVFGSNQTLTETVIGKRYDGYNVKAATKGSMNTPLAHTIATRANYGIKDTAAFPPKNALYILNDKKVDRTYIQKLDPQNISSIDILKDKKAIQEYGPAAKEGVIKIYTKEYEAAHPSNRPVILINGKVTKDKSALDKISPNEIDSVVVMKKDSPLLINQDGPQAKNGIVKIYTKAE